uniref:Response regulator n=1 Tax=Anaerolinea thermolimosa TaxID=229919 RepID=A0A7C4PKY4_9CHLR
MAGEQILVIEDNADNLELVLFLLEQAGFRGVGVSDGRQALEWLTDHRPDLILLDMSLPEIDGWELAGQLKANALTRPIPVVALTAHTLPGDRKRALDAGCDGYISKPLDVPHFAATIAGFLRGEAPV